MVRKNEAWVRTKVKDDPEMYNLKELRGAQLGYLCAHENCHFGVLVGAKVWKLQLEEVDGDEIRPLVESTAFFGLDTIVFIIGNKI